MKKNFFFEIYLIIFLMKKLFNLENAKPSFQFLFSLFILLVVFITFTFLGILIALPIFEISFSDFQNSKFLEEINFLKYVQTLQTFALFIIPPFIISYFFGKKTLNFLHFDGKINFEIFFIACLAMILSIPLISFLGEINSKLVLPEFLSDLELWMKTSEEKAEEMIKIFLKSDNLTTLFINILVIAVAPAFGEELLFRGIFQKIFTNWTKNIHWGIIISATIFSAFHLQFYGFLPRLLMGIFFGYLLFWSGTIWLPIFAHFINNASVTIIYFLVENKIINMEIENFENQMIDWKIVLFITFIVYFLIFKIYKKRI